MTREEAIKMLEYIKRIGNGESEYKNDAQAIAIDMAIKALEQESKTDILDKIRDEIEFEVDHRTNMLCAEYVFAILDKYKAESEEQK